LDGMGTSLSARHRQARYTGWGGCAAGAALDGLDATGTSGRARHRQARRRVAAGRGGVGGGRWGWVRGRSGSGARWRGWPARSPSTGSSPRCGGSRGCGVRALGVDPGTKRIGIAVSDLTGTIASPLLVLQRSKSPRHDLAEVARIARQEEAEVIVVGLPINMD